MGVGILKAQQVGIGIEGGGESSIPPTVHWGVGIGIGEGGGGRILNPPQIFMEVGIGNLGRGGGIFFIFMYSI